MKAKISKTYTLEDVSGEDLKTIVDALLEARRTSKDVSNIDRVTNEIWSIIKEEFTAVKDSTPQITKLETEEDIEDYFKRLELDTLLIPSEHFSFNIREGSEIVWFSIGKSGQFNISVWSNRDSYDEKDKPAYSVFFNKYCAELIKRVVDGSQKFVFSASIIEKGNRRSCNYYVDNKGKISFEKKMYVEYNTSYRTLHISKDGIDVDLSRIETLALLRFLSDRPEVVKND